MGQCRAVLADGMAAGKWQCFMCMFVFACIVANSVLHGMGRMGGGMLNRWMPIPIQVLSCVLSGAFAYDPASKGKGRGVLGPTPQGGLNHNQQY